MTKATIGVDVSKDHLDAYRWPEGDTVRVGNHAAGHRALIAWIGDAARVVLEPTGPYHRAFEQALATAGLPCARLNPTRVRRFAEALGTQAKTDRLDAGVIARMGAMLEPAPQAPDAALLADLKALQLARAALLRDRTAATNRAEQLHLPLLVRQNRLRLRQVERDLAAVDKAIAALVASDDKLARKAAILCSIPGLSAVSAATILAGMPELGSLEPKAAACLAGLAPITRQSGRWTGQARIRGGRASLRRALYMPALTAARFNPQLKAKYQALGQAGKPPKLALTVLMRKLLLLANALLRDNRIWSPTAP